MKPEENSRAERGNYGRSVVVENEMISGLLQRREVFCRRGRSRLFAVEEQKGREPTIESHMHGQTDCLPNV